MKKKNEIEKLIQKEKYTKYIKLFLACLPGAIAGIEFTIFWWNNNGLHTSRFDFWVAHPTHCIITTVVLFISLVLISILKVEE